MTVGMTIEQRQALRDEAKRLRPPLRDMPGLVRWAWSIAWSSGRWLVVSVALLRVLTALQAGLLVLLSRQGLHAAFDGSADFDLGRAAGPLIVVGVAAIVGSLAGVVSGQLQTLLGARVQKRTIDVLLDVTSTVELSEYESPAFYDRVKRCETNALIQPMQVVSSLIGLPANGIAIAGVVVALVLIEPLLLPLLLASIVPIALVSTLTGKQSMRFALQRVLVDRRRDYLRQVLVGRDEAKELRSFGAGTELRRRFEQLYDEYLRLLRRHQTRQTILLSLVTVVTLGVAITWVGLVAGLVASGRATGADLGAAGIGVGLLFGRFVALVSSLQTMYESSLFLADFRDFVAMRETAAGVPDQAGVAPATFAELVVDDVRFAYPGSDAEALRGVSCTIGAGEVVALVGENGSGKTTLAKLLADLYRPTSGRITWDGVDTATMDRASLRRGVAVIFQDYVRYQLSATDNIGLGLPEALGDGVRIVDAAQRGGADEFLHTLPDGYDTVLSKQFPGGLDLSIGQWQRVALARAFFRDAPFLILDEPTASLDARAEHALFQRIRELRQGRTVLLISHRFSSVRAADRILVLSKGELVEQGSHDDLIAADGLYAELYNLQANATLATS
jgi:ATP-binding cassette subfamily B protein